MSKKTRSHLRVALVGAGGRMGLEIQKLGEISSVAFAGTVDKPGDWARIDAEAVDVVIDFSSPEGLRGAVKWCARHSKPMVSGTTGLNHGLRRALESLSRKVPVLYSGNMSLGIAVFSAMIQSLSAITDWDFQIEEAHHNKKKDRPSGTALLLQEKLNRAIGRKAPGPLSLRGGGIPGIHTLWAMGPDESLTVTHTAFNRQVFARGALRAALWLFDKKRPGLYDLSDLYKT